MFADRSASAMLNLQEKVKWHYQKKGNKCIDDDIFRETVSLF